VCAVQAKRNEWPVVRGVCMNPVEHPFGGGNHQHIGKPSTVRRDKAHGRKVIPRRQPRSHLALPQVFLSLFGLLQVCASPRSAGPGVAVLCLGDGVGEGAMVRVFVHQLGEESLEVGWQWKRADAKLAAQRWRLTGHDGTSFVCRD
jgi:hypothetical protein